MTSYELVFKNEEIWIKTNVKPNRYDYIWGFCPGSKHGHAVIEQDRIEHLQQGSGITAAFHSGTALQIETQWDMYYISGTACKTEV